LTKSLPSVVRLEPISRYLFRRVVVVPALAGLAVGVALPLMTPIVDAQTIKSDSGSLGPIVSITKPEYSDVLKGDVQIVIAVQPRRYPAESVELLVDGRSVSGVLPIQNLFKWKTSLFPDGQHTLTVRVTDTQGFIGQSQTSVFINNSKTIVDTTAPVLNWVGLQNGQKLSGQVDVRLEARDDFGVKYVFLRLNPAITPDVKPPLASWMTNQPPYEFKLDTSKYEDGLYVLDAYTWDAQENEESAPRLTVGFFNHSLNPTTNQPVPIGENPSENVTDDKTGDQKVSQQRKTNDAAGSDTSGGATSDERTAKNPATPPAPPIIDFGLAVPRSYQGALHSTPVTGSGADLAAEHPQVDQVVSTPPLVLREASPLVKPLAKVPAAANPAPAKTDEAAKPSETVKTVETTKPDKPTIIARRPEEHPALPAAFSIQPDEAPESLLSPLTTTANLEILPGQRVAPSATLPPGAPRLAQLLAPPAGSIPGSTVNLEIGAATIASDNTVVNSVISAQLAPEGVRIAAVLPDELATTPPSQTVWRSFGDVAPAVSTHVEVAPSTPAFATTLPTSPNTAVTIVHSADQDPARDGFDFDALTTAPPLVPTPAVAPTKGVPPVEVQPKMSAAPSLTEDFGAPGDEAAHIARSDAPELNPQRSDAWEARETRPSEAPKVPAAPSQLAMLSPSVTHSTPKMLGRAAATQLATRAATRISFVPAFSFTAQPVSAAESARTLPSLPRVAMSPDLRRQATHPRADAGIVVSPMQPLETTAYTAMRDESLLAIADRFKMPLSVVAAANGLAPNAQVTKGTQLFIPRSLQVSYKGQPITGDVAPLLIGQTSVGAFRFLFEKQGGTLSWDAENQQVHAKNDKYEVTLTIGSDKAMVNQKEEMMDMAAFLLSGRTMVPIRFFESALNAKVEWEPSTGRIYVASSR
jgi:LysM repeat protein